MRISDWSSDVCSSDLLPEGTEMVMPGDNVTMSVELIAPIAMDEGLRFAIREGGRTVGAGVVASIQKQRAPASEGPRPAAEGSRWVAQLVEHWSPKPGGGGSRPPRLAHPDAQMAGGRT